MEHVVFGQLAFIKKGAVCWQDKSDADIHVPQNSPALMLEVYTACNMDVARLLHPDYGTINCLTAELELVNN